MSSVCQIIDRLFFGSVSNEAAQILTKRLVLTDAQIKALPTTPVALVSAPGAGYIIKPIACTVIKNVNAAGYTNINTSYCAIPQIFYNASPFRWACVAGWVNDDTVTPALTDATTYFNTPSKHTVHLVTPNMVALDESDTPFASEWILNYAYCQDSEIDNVALAVSADNNGSGNFTGGNAANSMTITMYYVLELH